MRPKIIVSGMVKKDGKYLLIKRADKPYQGYWSDVGGKLELEETPEQGIQREFMEEMGVKVQIKRFLGYYNHVWKEEKTRHIVTLLFLCEPENTDFKVDEKEVSEVGWFTIQQAEKLDLAFDVKKRLEDAEHEQV